MKENSKTQEIRLIDVFFIGPYLVYLAWKGNVTVLDKVVLGIIGGSTLFYNLRNFIRNRQNRLV